MVAASVTAGRAEAGEMVWTPAPAMLKEIESVPACAFDSMMAARRVQLPVPSLQTPSPGLLSAPSPVELTTKLALAGGVQLLRRTKTLFEGLSATARSGLPAPLKSLAATDCGEVPAAKLWGGPKLPAPSPMRTEALPAKRLAVTMSSLPSPLMSPTATETGPFSVAKLLAALKPPVPSPMRTETLFEPRLAVTMTWLPS